MNLNFYMPTKIITGKNCIKNNKDVFSTFGKSCLIVTGKTSAKKCGALDDVTNILDELNIKYDIFNGIEQNPTYNSCLKGALLAKKTSAEFIIGIGGGSPLDAAKAVAVLAANSDTSENALYSMNWESTPLPVIAIGTTSGTGSEVTPVSVITNSDGMKKSFRSNESYPKVSFGDATYTMSLSEDFTRSTALDALSHCIEAYFNRTTNDMARTFAIKGIKILINELKKTAKKDFKLSFEDRELLYNASIYGGLAISVAGTCFPHGMGYFLSEQFNVPHGNACAVYLEEFINHNENVALSEVNEFFKELNIEKDEFINLIKSNLFGVDLKLTDEKIEELLPRFDNNKNFKKCYGDIGKDFAEDVLNRLFK